MARTPSLKRIQKSYITRVNGLLKSNHGFRNVLSDVMNTGDNYVSGKYRQESKVYDEKWVSQLEAGFAAIDRIIQNPRKFIKEEQEVVISALAKKVTSASIEHLASHSEFVHSVDAKGNVIPEKILTINTEEDVQIYENRFVMTLIQKLVLFIERRYSFIKSHGETRNSDVLLIHSKTTIDGVTYEVDNRLKVSVPSADEGEGEHNAELLAKITRLRERASFYLHCPFMQSMAGAKPVHNPLAMTNMLLKEPNYHKAYQLWKFIDSYTKLGVSYSVKEENEAFDNEYYQEIYSLVLGDMMSIRSSALGDKKAVLNKGKRKILTPKVLMSLEDETFLNGKFNYDPFGYKPMKMVTKEDEKLAPAPDKVKEMELEEKARAKEVLLRSQEMQKKAEALKEKALKEEALRLARQEQKRALAEKKELDRLAAKKRKEEAAKAKAEALYQKKKELDALELEKELLRKMRESVRKEGFNDRKKEPSRVRKEEPAKPVTPIVKKEEPKVVVKPVIAPKVVEIEVDKPLRLPAPLIAPIIIRIPEVKKAKPTKKRKPVTKKKVIKKPVIKKVSEQPAPLVAPIVKEEPKPVVKEEPKPVVKEEPKPVVKEEPKPVVKEEPKPVVKEEPKPVVKEEPKPVTKPKAKKKPAPKKKAAPKKKPTPKKAVIKPAPKPVVKEEPKPVVKEEPKPVVVVPAKPEKKKKKPFIRVSYAKKKDVKINLKKKGKKFVPVVQEIEDKKQ